MTRNREREVRLFWEQIIRLSTFLDTKRGNKGKDKFKSGHSYNYGDRAVRRRKKNGNHLLNLIICQVKL